MHLMEDNVSKEKRPPISEVVIKEPGKPYFQCLKEQGLYGQMIEEREARKRARYEAKLKEKEAFKEKAKGLVPEILALDMVKGTNPDYQFPASTLIKLREILNSGAFTLSQLRTRVFRDMSDEGWHYLTKMLFRNHMGHVEEMGLELLQVKRRSIEMIRSRIATLKEEVRDHKKRFKDLPAPLGLYSLIAKSEDEIMKIELDLAKTLHQVGAVGSKNQGGATLHIHTSIPRPGDDAKVINVDGGKVSVNKKMLESAKQGLDNLINENVDNTKD